MDIYILKNFSQKEIYFGLSEGELKKTISAHRDNPDSPLGHWNWDGDEIKWGTVQEELYETNARAFMQALRREPPEDGWVVVVGGE